MKKQNAEMQNTSSPAPPGTRAEKMHHYVRFIAAGVANTAVHFIVFSLLIGTMSIEVANVFAFLTANLFSFFVASYFVFKVRSRSFRQYLLFLCVSSVGAAISYGIGIFCGRMQLPPLAAPLLVAVIIPPISYLLQRFVFWGKATADRKTP